jgi:hypothetical protein
MKRTIISVALILVCILAQAQKVNVAAAANLRYVLEEIKVQYEKEHPKAKINITFRKFGHIGSADS